MVLAGRGARAVMLPTVADVMQAAEDYLRAPTKTQAQLYKQDLALKVAKLRAAAAGESFDTVLREALAALREVPDTPMAMGAVAGRHAPESITDAVLDLIRPRQMLRLVQVSEEVEP